MRAQNGPKTKTDLYSSPTNDRRICIIKTMNCYSLHLTDLWTTHYHLRMKTLIGKIVNYLVATWKTRQILKTKTLALLINQKYKNLQIKHHVIIRKLEHFLFTYQMCFCTTHNSRKLQAQIKKILISKENYLKLLSVSVGLAIFQIDTEYKTKCEPWSKNHQKIYVPRTCNEITKRNTIEKSLKRKLQMIE